MKSVFVKLVRLPSGFIHNECIFEQLIKTSQVSFMHKFYLNIVTNTLVFLLLAKVLQFLKYPIREGVEYLHLRTN